jgi:cyclohexanone monooxygenase
VRIGKDAIVTADGQPRPVDVIVVATGFHATDNPAAELIKRCRRPDAGRSLA